MGACVCTTERAPSVQKPEDLGPPRVGFDIRSVQRSPKLSNAREARTRSSHSMFALFVILIACREYPVDETKSIAIDTASMALCTEHYLVHSLTLLSNQADLTSQSHPPVHQSWVFCIGGIKLSAFALFGVFALFDGELIAVDPHDAFTRSPR